MNKRILISFTILLFLCATKNINALDTTSISANPAATNIMTGSASLQKAIEKYVGITNDHGVRIGGMWIADINELLTGGTSSLNHFSANNLIQLSLSVDGEKMMGWKGSLFDIEGLQFNGQDTNGDAGSVQGYNSLPGAPPLTRTELYQLWYRQKLFDNKFIVRIGKSVPTFDFNNVVKPVPLNENNIPAVSGLIYTPLFVNATMLGVLPGYYNSAYGIELTFAPMKEWYTSVAAYDGSGAQGIQTGNQGLVFNGSYFYIGETGFSWLLGENKKPGNMGIGVWHQDGLITSSNPDIYENSASGVYVFGSQRLWYKNPGTNDSGISGFYQYGINNSDALRMQQYVGAGLTAFDMIPNRPADTLGVGIALSWLNQKIFANQTELMFQAYYQAKIMDGFYLEPVLSYIPTPGDNADTPAALAGTVRAVILF
jgi:porin